MRLLLSCLWVLLSLSVPGVEAGQFPRYGGNVIIRVPLLPAELEPLRWRGDTNNWLSANVYEGLVRWGELGIIPSLAHAWNASDDSKTWVFHLQRDVVFHDGTACDASSIIESLHRLADPKISSFAWMLEDLEGWQDYVSGSTSRIEGLFIQSPHEIEMHFAEPVPDLLVRLALPSAAIVRWAGMVPVGTGPFRVVQSDSRRARLAAFEEHHEGRPFLDGLDLSIDQKPPRAAEARIRRVIPEKVEAGSVSLLKLEPQRLGFALVHPQSAILYEAKLREELSKSFDRDLFVKATLFERGSAAYGVFPQSTRNRASLGEAEKGDLAQSTDDQARILVEENEPVLQQLAERLQVHLFAVGIRSEIEVLPPDAFEVGLLAETYDIVLLGWTAPQPRRWQVEASTQVRALLSSVIEPTLRDQMPMSWQAVLRGARRASEEVLLQESLLIPLVFYHETYGIEGALTQVKTGRAGLRIDLRDAYLRPPAP